jgi:hypothetical protein
VIEINRRLGKFHMKSIRSSLLGPLERVFCQLEATSPLRFLDDVEIPSQPARVGPFNSHADVRFELFGCMRSAA